MKEWSCSLHLILMEHIIFGITHCQYGPISIFRVFEYEVQVYTRTRMLILLEYVRAFR